MEKHRYMEGKGKRAMDTTQGTRASPNSLETHLVRKWEDIGHQWAVGPGIKTIFSSEFYRSVP